VLADPDIAYFLRPCPQDGKITCHLIRFPILIKGDKPI